MKKTKSNFIFRMILLLLGIMILSSVAISAADPKPEKLVSEEPTCGQVSYDPKVSKCVNGKVSNNVVTACEKSFRNEGYTCVSEPPLVEPGGDLRCKKEEECKNCCGEGKDLYCCKSLTKQEKKASEPITQTDPSDFNSLGAGSETVGNYITKYKSNLEFPEHITYEKLKKSSTSLSIGSQALYESAVGYKQIAGLRRDYYGIPKYILIKKPNEVTVESKDSENKKENEVIKLDPIEINLPSSFQKELGVINDVVRSNIIQIKDQQQGIVLSFKYANEWYWGTGAEPTDKVSEISGDTEDAKEKIAVKLTGTSFKSGIVYIMQYAEKNSKTIIIKNKDSSISSFTPLYTGDQSKFKEKEAIDLIEKAIFAETPDYIAVKDSYIIEVYSGEGLLNGKFIELRYKGNWEARLTQDNEFSKKINKNDRVFKSKTEWFQNLINVLSGSKQDAEGNYILVESYEAGLAGLSTQLGVDPAFLYGKPHVIIKGTKEGDIRLPKSGEKISLKEVGAIAVKPQDEESSNDKSNTAEAQTAPPVFSEGEPVDPPEPFISTLIVYQGESYELFQKDATSPAPINENRNQDPVQGETYLAEKADGFYIKGLTKDKISLIIFSTDEDGKAVETVPIEFETSTCQKIQEREYCFSFNSPNGLYVTPDLKSSRSKTQDNTEENSLKQISGNAVTSFKNEEYAHGEKRSEDKIEYVVLHHTGSLTVQERKDFLKINKVSTHYLIDKEGNIEPIISEDTVAWHARGRNPDSIGIDLVNTGNANDPYTEKQYEVLNELFKQLATNYPNFKKDDSHVLGHYQVVKGRWNPSPNFEWKKIGLPLHPKVPISNVPKEAGYAFEDVIKEKLSLEEVKTSTQTPSKQKDATKQEDSPYISLKEFDAVTPAQVRANVLSYKEDILTVTNSNKPEAVEVSSIMAHESKGIVNARSGTGCVGLMQICSGSGLEVTTAQIKALEITTCIPYSDGKCYVCAPKEAKECKTESIIKKIAGKEKIENVTTCMYGCKIKAYDNRLDPKISIAGGYTILKDKINYIKNKCPVTSSEEDKFKMALGAYNGGQGVICAAVKKTGKKDPTWEEVSAELTVELLRSQKDYANLKLWPTNESLERKIKEIDIYPGKVVKSKPFFEKEFGIA